jgi:hypothetical protein
VASSTSRSTIAENSFNLLDFGAVGDGMTDDGPALQNALDAMAQAGGGTLFVPAGRYAIVTPVQKDFTGSASDISITGVESETPVPPPNSTGNVLTRGLDLTSEFAPRTGETAISIQISGLQNFLIKDITFIGTPGVSNDALITLALNDISAATVRHCEFYGLSSLVAGGAIVQAVRCNLTFEQSVVLGSTCASGFYSSVIQNVEWKGITISEAVFADYGQRAELYGKMTTAPFSWINIGNAAVTNNDSPRREVVVRSLFLDEGGYMGLSSLTYRFSPPSAAIDLLYITNLFMNVSNFGTTGNFLYGLERVLIEKAHYGWSHNADSAIQLLSVGNAIIDEAECVDGANRIGADAGTGRLTVINSIYDELNSQAQTTKVITTVGPEDDPVQYVRQQFASSLNRDPDAAAHFYWADQILQCGDDSPCANDKRAKLAEYLAATPSPFFSISGLATDEAGTPLSGVSITLSGAQAATTTTNSAGLYHFSNLPTSGGYTVNASKTHYTFNSPSKIFITPAGNQTADFAATLNRHSIAGHVADTNGNAVGGATVNISGTQSGTTTTNASGDFLFANLPAGGTYTVNGSKTHYAFSSSVSFTDLSADQTANFMATLNRHNITGRASGPGGGGLAGVTLTLVGAQTTTTTTDSNGTYAFVNLPAGDNYTIRPSKTSYSWSPQSLTFNDLGSNQTANFTGTFISYNVSGRVTENGAGLSGVSVLVSGSQSAVATTDAQGNYLFTLPSEGNYTVTPSKQYYTLTPPTQTLNNLLANQTCNFAATRNRHQLSGRVVNINNSGIPGVSVSLSGAQTATTTTDSGGNYSFTNLPAGGTYTVRAVLQYYSFNPDSQTYPALESNQNTTFIATLNTHTISGRVANTSGVPLAGVTVALSGSLGPISSITTSADGTYSFGSLSAGSSYVVAVSKRDYTFNPPTRTFSDLSSNQTADFTGALNVYSIAGRVSVGQTGTSGVLVTLTGSLSGQATTDVNGNYSFSALGGGTYTVTVSKTHYSFSPPSRTFANLSSNQTGDFTATRDVHSIAGRVTLKGTGLSGVVVTLTGSQSGSITTDSTGNYSFSAFGGGDYTVTVSKTNYTFDPPSRTFTNLSTNQTGDFVATLNIYSISGRVILKGTGLSGVTITLTGSQSGSATTDDNGDYSLKVPAESTVTLTPAKATYDFSPGRKTFSNLSGNQSADFEASLQTLIEFNAASYNVSEATRIIVVTVTRSGNTSGESEVVYSATDGSAQQRGDLIPVIGRLTFAAGETSKSFTVLVTDDAYVEGDENVTLNLSDLVGCTAGNNITAILTITDNDNGAPSTNPIDEAVFFVRQQYRDFLNRPADADGLAFWSNQIISCGTDTVCISDRRTNVSAAFFLSIEFQQTGFLVYRLYQASFGQAPEHLDEFLLDTRTIGQGVIVNDPGWQELLEANTISLLEDFVSRSRFNQEYPLTLAPSEFVNRLNSKTGDALTPDDLAAAVAEFNGASSSSDVQARARALRRVAENTTFSQRQLNRAFVLMQYFGYLQRNPSDAPDTNLDGYNFWLHKLEEFGGDFRRAEMVKSFLISTEYRARFGAP